MTTTPSPEASQDPGESPVGNPPTTVATQSSQEPEESPLYHISFERIDEMRRSAVTLLADRRGPGCPSLLLPKHELDDPQELLNEIAEYSAGEEGFISSNMPLQEIVFRMLLTRRNQPTTLEELHNELTERWSTPVRPINITLKSLERILNSDNYYGFAPK